MVKKIKAEIGTLFLVPRKDGLFVLGQILEEWMPGVVCIALFDCIASKDVLINIDGGLSIFSMPSVSKSEISKGHWRAVGKAEIVGDVERAPHSHFKASNYLGAAWHSGGMVEKLVDAYYGLGTWDPYPGRPGFLKTLILPRPH